MVKTVSSLRDLRVVMESWRQRDETVGFIPTLGALHENHIALVKQAQNLSTRTVVSIFLNPLQFANAEEMERYKTNPEDDERLLSQLGVDLIFAPSIDVMLPQGFSTMVDPGPIANILEGKLKPGHFIGIATAMTKLLMQVMPDYAFISERDYQQLRVVEQVVKDLHIPVGLIPVPVARDVDDLVWSSQNAYLSKSERITASVLPQVLRTGVEDIRSEHSIEATLAGAIQHLEDAGAAVDFFDLVDSRTLTPTRDLRKPARLMASVVVGTTRLVDNMPIQ